MGHGSVGWLCNNKISHLLAARRFLETALVLYEVLGGIPRYWVEESKVRSFELALPCCAKRQFVGYNQISMSYQRLQPEHCLPLFPVLVIFIRQ